MDFLKKLTTPVFQVIGYGQGVVQFTCGKSLQLGANIDAFANLPGGGRCALSVRVEDGQGGRYAGAVLGPPETLALLEKTFLPNERDSKSQMFYKPDEESMTRHARTYALRCRDFPNFKGMTAELSREGALVILTGPVQAGLETQVTVDLDDTDIEPFTVDAKVEWCIQREEKAWVCDLSFRPLPPEVDELMKAFLEKLKRRAPGSREVL